MSFSVFYEGTRQYTEDGQVLPLKEYGWRRQMTEEADKLKEAQHKARRSNLSAIDFRRRAAERMTKEEALAERRFRQRHS